MDIMIQGSLSGCETALKIRTMNKDVIIIFLTAYGTEEMKMVTENLTMVNLMKAFAGESMARNKYEYFAKVAQKEGYHDIAAHFQRAANNEKTHAKLELALHNKMQTNSDNNFGDTQENLQMAIDGEHYEHVDMYPDFAKIAKEDGYDEAARLFKGIGKIEIEHEKMFLLMLGRMKNGTVYESDLEDEAWICEVCGHIHYGNIHYGKKALEVCPVCNTHNHTSHV